MDCPITDEITAGLASSPLTTRDGLSTPAEASRSFGWPCATVALSGLMMSSCYWPVNAHWMAWISLVPWLVILPRVSARGAWVYGTALGLIFYSVGLAWLFEVNGLMAVIVVLVLAVWVGLAFRVARLLMDRFSPAAMMWALPVAFVGQEVLRCEGLAQLRLPFMALGYSQSQNEWVAQIASVGGVYGISFLIVVVNATLAWGIAQRRWRALVPAELSILAVLLMAAASQPGDYSRLPRIPAACIQVENHSRSGDLAREAIGDPSRPRLLVLPEHIITEYATENHPLFNTLADMAQRCRALICVGVHTKAPRGAVCDFNNVSMLIGTDGRVLAEQPKMIPLPFFQDGVPGRTQSVIKTEFGTVGTYVCYDGLFTDVPRRVAEAGAQVMLVPNMDDASWPSQERWQHAEMARFRSIELRRCAVRANGAGISQIIDATGRVIAWRTEGDGAGIVLGDVYPASERTLFVRGGYLFAPIVGMGFIGIVLWLTFAEWRGRLAVVSNQTIPSRRVVHRPEDGPAHRKCACCSLVNDGSRSGRRRRG